MPVAELLAGLGAQAAATGPSIVVTAPFTGRPLGAIPQSTVEDVGAAYDRARQAQRFWAKVSPRERRAAMLRFAELLTKHRNEIADLLQWETGKARVDAMYEVGEAVLAAVYCAKNAEAVLRPRRRQGTMPGLTVATELRHPKGVVAVITPWNFPVALAVADLAPALMAGNAVVLKPDNQTAHSALWLRRLAVHSGLPAELLQVVLGEPAQVGDPLLDHADFICFTGSTATGRVIAARAAQRLVGCTLELGGKNPMIVLPDADLRRAAGAVPRTCFGNSGQLCMAVERLYVHESVRERFLDLMLERVAGISQGMALDFSRDLGSLTTPALHERVVDQVRQARELGARVLFGGRARPDLGPLFHEPTVLADVPKGATLRDAETFGPVVSVYPFTDVDEVVELANDSEYGLSASVWTRDTGLGRRVAARIRAGGVNVNDGYAAAFGSHGAPAGGMKSSGLGRRHGAEGLLKYTEGQTVAVQRLVSLDSRFGLPSRIHGAVVGPTVELLRRLRTRW